MINISIVLYKNEIKEVLNILKLITKSNLINQIYLIDNSPTDILKNIIIDNFNIDNLRIKYLFNNKNLGYGSGHNIAIKNSIKQNIPFHLVLNSDISFDIDNFRLLVQYLNDNTDVALVSPKIIDSDGVIQFHCKLVPSPLDLIARILFPNSNYTKGRNKKFEMHQYSYDEQMYAPYLSGCFMFLRTSSLEKVGLFDERFFMYPEDIDLSRRLADIYRTMYLPKIYIIHGHRKASYKSIKMMLIHCYNMILYFNKWGWIFDSKKTELNIKIKKWNNNGTC